MRLLVPLYGEGIPDSLRGYAWQVMSGGRELRVRNPGIYDQLVFFENSTSDHGWELTA
jgi:hypothetical protein